MGDTLQKRIDTLIRAVFGRGPGAWLVWCDPRGEWLPLLKRVAADQRMGGFPLVVVDDRTAGALGGPQSRSALQARLDAGESFLLAVQAAATQLGWLWSQALLAERIYDRSLRSQLMEWGWQPHSLSSSDQEVAALALAKLQQDPAEWGSGGLQPDPERLLAVLSGLQEPDDETRVVLDLTVDQAGLPPIDDADLMNWRRQGLARLLATQAHLAAPDLIPAGHTYVIAPPHQDQAQSLLTRWVDSHSLVQRLPDLMAAADDLCGVAGQLAAADATAGPFVSHAAERVVFASTCERLAQMEGRTLLESLAALAEAIERHAQGLWGRRMAGAALAVPWSELGRLSAAAQELLDATPPAAWTTPQAAIDWYVAGGWRIDRAGDEIERSLTPPTRELTDLIGPLRRALRARWEETLLRWSELWTQAGCPIPAHLPSAGEWLKRMLDEPSTPTAILVLDALRYDLGATLAQWVNHQEGVERATVTPAHAPFPSITALGMGMALPLDAQQLEAALVDGKWQLRLHGAAANLSDAAQRRQWWSQRANTVVVPGLATILNGESSPPGPACQTLVVYDGTIDRQGHDDELAFQGSRAVLNRYLAAVEHLRDRGWRRILVVTDHGFIRWSGSHEHHVAPPRPEPAYASRRAVAYSASTALDGPQGLAPGGVWKVAFPHGAACFRTYGGLGYFHGGASLQEWIIPCAAIAWPQTAQVVTITLEPLPHILSLRPRVTLTVATGSLLREDSIPRQVEIVIRDAQSQALLFRSDVLTVSAADAQQEVALNAVDGAVAPRNTALQIQARDPRTELPLAMVESSLMIELTGW